MTRNVRANQRRAELLGLEGRNLHVNRADAGALGVVKNRAVQRAGYMVLLELAFGADVDDLVKLGELCYGDSRCFTHGISSCIALLRQRGW